MQAEEKSLEVRNLIGGSWEEKDGRDTEPVYDPATGEVVAETPLSTTGVAAQPGNAASACFTARSTSSLVERGVSATTSPVAGL